MFKNNNFKYLLFSIILVLILLSGYLVYNFFIKEDKVSSKNLLTQEMIDQAISSINNRVAYLENKKDMTITNITEMNDALKQTENSIDAIKSLKPDDQRITILQDNVLIIKEILTSLENYSSYIDNSLLEFSNKLSLVKDNNISAEEFDNYMADNANDEQGIINLITEKAQSLKTNSSKVN